MLVDLNIFKQIVSLINNQNRLAQHQTLEMLLDKGHCIVSVNDEGTLVGCVRVVKVQWYQWELFHLSVLPDYRRQGQATALLLKAEAHAKQEGASIVQCTVRMGNVESEALFSKSGYTAGAVFTNRESGNMVRVYQKSL
jgi:ribosomal protein S18 acetylase RimI-like enzyme